MSDKSAIKKLTAYNRFDPKDRLIKNKMAVFDSWTVAGGLSFYVGKRVREEWVHVPANYVLTGLELPRAVRQMMPFNAFESKALVIYEFLQRGGKIKQGKELYTPSYPRCIGIFNNALAVAEVPLTTRLYILLRTALFRLFN